MVGAADARHVDVAKDSLFVRILLASPYDLTHLGGVTSHVFDLAEQFKLLGHQVTVAGPTSNGRIHHAGVHRLGSSFRFPSPGDAARINLNPLIALPVQELLSREDFDVFHLHEPFLGFIGASFLRYGEGLKVGTFHTWRQGTHLPYRVFGSLVRRWNRRLDGRIAVSDSARETVNRYVPDDYTVIPNAIYFDDFAYPEVPPEHLDDDRPTILFVGRLEARKGVPTLLEAFGALKTRISTARLVIVGDGGLKKTWENLAQQMNLKDVLFEGYVDREHLPAYYHRADVFCSPSVANESFGITLLEAMAAGRPVVATANNGSSTLGEHGVTGLVVEPRDAEALAQSLEWLLEDRKLADRLGDAARQRGRLFDWPVVARSILDYYAEKSGAPAPALASRLSV
jgi:phosphatidylinositol alpha-mannosyltransferase